MFSKASILVAAAGAAGSLLLAAPAMASVSGQCKGLNTCVPTTLPAPAPSYTPPAATQLPSSTNCGCSATLVYATVTTQVPATKYVQKTYTTTVPVTSYVKNEDKQGRLLQGD